MAKSLEGRVGILIPPQRDHVRIGATDFPHSFLEPTEFGAVGLGDSFLAIMPA
jgi:hypothetical protein